MALPRSKRARALVLCLAALHAPPANAGDGCDAPEPASFRIVHEVFGTIGRHEVAFKCEGDELIVETAQSIDVEVLGIGAYERTARYRERWRDGQLLTFTGRTVEDGETNDVVATHQDDRMVIDGPAGRIEAPPTLVPDNPWNADLVERPLLFDVSSGELLRVDVHGAGPVTLEVEGRRVRADKYVRTGDREHELWYADGTWLRWRLKRATGDVTFLRESLPRDDAATNGP